MTPLVPTNPVLCHSMFRHPLTRRKQRSDSKNLWYPPDLAHKWTADAVFCKGLNQILLVSGLLTNQGIRGREWELIDLKQKAWPVKPLLQTLECWNGYLVRVKMTLFCWVHAGKYHSKFNTVWSRVWKTCSFSHQQVAFVYPGDQIVLTLGKASADLLITQRDFCPSLLRENSFKLVRFYLRRVVIICAAVNYRILQS